MTDLEQRAHDFAVLATLNYSDHKGEAITDKNAFEAGIHYRHVFREFLHSLEEGQSDLR